MLLNFNSADEVGRALGSEWARGTYGSKGGGKHGGAYYGISSGATGKVKVVNPKTYIPLP